MRILLAFFIILLATPAIAAPIKVGYFQLIPHSSFMDKSDKEGIALQYFRLIAQKMQFDDYSLQLLPLIRLISMVSQSEVDMALYLGKNENRAKLVQYSSIPLFMMKPSLIVKKGRYKIAQFTPQVLKQMNICAWKEGYLSKTIIEHAREITEMTGLDISTRCIEMVRRDRLDAFFSPDHLTLHYELILSKFDHELEVIPLIEPEVGLYTTFSPKTDKDFIRRFDQALQELSRDLPYMKFYEQQLETHRKD